MTATTPRRTPSTALPIIPPGGGEDVVLKAFLDYHRTIARRKVEGLTDADLWRRLPGHPSPLTVGGILKHLAWVEIKWSQHVFLGVPYPQIAEPWASRRGTDPDWEWDVRQDTAQDVLSWYDAAVDIARSAYDSAPSLDTVSRNAGSADPGTDTPDDAVPYELRWILTHLLEEYARHAGHLDLLREVIDGTTGN